MPHTPHGVKFESNRPVVMGRNGMVCAGHPLASLAGMARCSSRAVTPSTPPSPWPRPSTSSSRIMSGIGGDGFILVLLERLRERAAQARGLRSVNATGSGPARRPPDVELVSPERHPHEGHPGPYPSRACWTAGWPRPTTAYGDPEVAGRGVRRRPSTWPRTAFPCQLTWSPRVIAERPSFCADLPRPPGRSSPPAAAPMRRQGQIHLRQPGPGPFLPGRLPPSGRDTFYEGRDSGGPLPGSARSNGGALSMKDLEGHRTAVAGRPSPPPTMGNTVYEAPPNSSGHILLQELNVVEHPGHPGPGVQHSRRASTLMVEAKKLAFADREVIRGRPRVRRGAHRRPSVQGVRQPSGPALIDPETGGRGESRTRRPVALTRAPPTTPADGRPSCDVGVRCRKRTPPASCVVDRWGNAVCQLQSIQSSAGAPASSRGTRASC